MESPRSLRYLYLAPFDSSFQDIRKTVYATLDKLGGVPYQIGSPLGNIDRSVNAAYDADLVIADLTSSYPEIMYTVGVAHTLGKPVLLMVQRTEQKGPLGGYLYLIYDPNDLEGLEKKIEEWVTRIVSGIERGHAVA
jgi:hypothetical protein